MRLPLPCKINGKLYTHAEVKRPTSGTLADVTKMIDADKKFEAARILVCGIVTELSGEAGAITDKVALKGAIPKLPYKSIEFLATQAQLLTKPEADLIEGVYYCPRCSYRIISEYSNTDGVEIDTRDRLSAQPCDCAEEVEEVLWELESSVDIINDVDKSVLYTVNNMTFRHPTLEDAIRASQKYSKTDRVRMQYGIYLECLTHINGEEADAKFKANYGMYVFNNIPSPEDLQVLTGKMQKYGINPYVSKECPDCGKQFKVVLQTTGFFGSARGDM